METFIADEGERDEVRVMTQRWQDLLFAHWDFEPDLVRSLLPPHLEDFGIELDCFEGRAYVGLVPFNMRDLHVRGLPKIPTTVNFAEVNVRTYLRYEGRPLVWFFSLDTAHLLPTLVARLAFRLPYCLGRTSVTLTGSDEGSVYACHVERRWPDRAVASLAARLGSPVDTTPLREFLTARWGLIATSAHRGAPSTREPRVWFGAVEHEPWPLQSATLLDLDGDLFASAGLDRPHGDPILLFSRGVTTTVHSLTRLRPL